jgi:RHS repeat-associated protein
VTWHRTILVLCVLLLGSVDTLALRSSPWEFTGENRGTAVLDNGVSRARYYNPDQGRFWTMDTAKGEQSKPLSLHKYLYASANPVNRIDPSGLADYSLTIAYKGVRLTEPEGAAELWYETVDGLDYRFKVPGWQHRIFIPIGRDDNIFDLIRNTLDSAHLVPGIDRITDIVIAGHGHHGGGFLGGLWSATASTSDLETYKLQDPQSPHAKMLDYLKPWTSGHCGVQLRACFQAEKPQGPDFMEILGRALGANVTGYTDEYGLVGWGDEYNVTADGRWSMKQGRPWKGSWVEHVANWDQYVGINLSW